MKRVNSLFIPSHPNAASVFKEFSKRPFSKRFQNVKTFSPGGVVGAIYVRPQATGLRGSTPLEFVKILNGLLATPGEIILVGSQDDFAAGPARSPWVGCCRLSEPAHTVPMALAHLRGRMLARKVGLRIAAPLRGTHIPPVQLGKFNLPS